MPRLPDPYAQQPDQLRPVAGITPQPDTRAVGRATEGLGQQIERLGLISTDIGNERLKRKQVADDQLAAAAGQTELLRDHMAAQQEFQNEDPSTDGKANYTTWSKRFEDRQTALLNSTAEKITDPRAKQAYMLEGQRNIMLGAAKFQDQAHHKELSDIQARLVDTVQNNVDLATSATDTDMRKQILSSTHAEIDAAEAKGAITPLDAVKMRRGVAKDMGENYIATLPPEQLANLKAGQKTGTLFDFVPAPQQERAIEHAGHIVEADKRQREADVARAAAEEKQATAESRAWGAVDLERKIKSGDANLRDIEAARAAGNLSPSQYDGLTTTWDAKERARLKELENEQRISAEVGRVGDEQQAAISRVGDALSPQGPILNPKNKADKDAVDAYFTKNAQGMQPQEIQDLAITLSAKTGIVPPTIIAQMNGAVRGAPDRRAWAASTFEQLDRQAPQAADDIPDDTKRSARLMSQYLMAGNGPADAANIVDRDLGVTDTVKTEREKFINEGGTSSPKELAWTWFRGSSAHAARADQPFLEAGQQGLNDPDLSLEVKGEFEKAYNLAYRATGNEAASRAEASSEIKKRWGVTDADNKRRWMKYPPEMVYGGGNRASSEWIGKQLVDQTSTITGVPAEKLTGTVSLISDPLTARAMSAGVAPTYGVLRIDPDTGLPDLVRAADGSPYRFQPTLPKPEDTHAAEVTKLQEERSRLMAPSSYAPGGGEAMP